MSTAILSDKELQRDILNELRFDPSVNAAHIGVSVKNGVVTLTGHVPSYAEKFTAEDAVKRVHGVRAIANEIDVKLPDSSQRTDEDIATDVVYELKSNSWVPSNRIKVSVSEGWVKLEGAVDWHYQKEAAENSVRYLRGVKGVSNLIRVKPHVPPEDLAAKIRDAFLRSAETDAQRIHVEAQGSKVILRGKVRSWAERQEAERTAWSAPGVTEVENQLVVVRRKPTWLVVTVLVVILALLVAALLWPMFLFFRG